MVEKLSQGKFTVKGLFKTNSEKAHYQAKLLDRISQSERDINNWETIRKIVIIYLVEIAIPDFKKGKTQKYIKAIQGFSKDELNNAKKHQNCWSDFCDLMKEFDTEEY